MKAKRVPNGFRSVFRQNRPSDALTWLSDVTGRCARLTALGASRLLVENHRGIISLGDTRVTLDTGDGPVTVTGENLRLCQVRRGALIVEGTLRQVCLPCEGGDDPR